MGELGRRLRELEGGGAQQHGGQDTEDGAKDGGTRVLMDRAVCFAEIPSPACVSTLVRLAA